MKKIRKYVKDKYNKNKSISQSDEAQQDQDDDPNFILVENHIFRIDIHNIEKRNYKHQRRELVTKMAECLL